MLELIASQGNKRSYFKAKQDIVLLREVIAAKPFLAPHGQQEAAWQSVAAELRKNGFRATFRAARDRFALILRVFQSAERESLRKSGTYEEYEEREHLLTEILNLQNEAKAMKSQQKKQQMLDSAMADRIREEAMRSLKPQKTAIRAPQTGDGVRPAKQAARVGDEIGGQQADRDDADVSEQPSPTQTDVSQAMSSTPSSTRRQTFAAALCAKEDRRLFEAETERIKSTTEVEKIALAKQKLKLKEAKMQMLVEEHRARSEEHRAQTNLINEMLKRFVPAPQ